MRHEVQICEFSNSIWLALTQNFGDVFYLFQTVKKQLKNCSATDRRAHSVRSLFELELERRCQLSSCVNWKWIAINGHPRDRAPISYKDPQGVRGSRSFPRQVQEWIDPNNYFLEDDIVGTAQDPASGRRLTVDCSSADRWWLFYWLDVWL